MTKSFPVATLVFVLTIGVELYFSRTEQVIVFDCPPRKVYENLGNTSRI